MPRNSGIKEPRIRTQRQLKLISLESSFSPSVSQTIWFGFRSKTNTSAWGLKPQVENGSVRELYAFLPA